MGVTSAVARNWDLLVVAVVVAAALLADLWRGLRERDFVVAGPDGLVVRVRGTTTSWAWAAVAGVEPAPVRSGRRRAVVLLVDGTTARLPRDAPVDDLARWVRELGG
ncbi:hypothetical protein [Aquipuribacter sp. MA13-13]|uniref:hypothetical protein n=1 Tax=Aquipuribacter sp. MA13-13 TaxID=3440840 RepID=UPI003EED8A24